MGYDKKRVEGAIESLGDYRNDYEAVQELLDHVESIARQVKARNSVTMEVTVRTKTVTDGIQELREMLTEHDADLSAEAISAITQWLRNQIEVRKAS